MVEKRDWKVYTRTHGPTISVSTEIVTTFLNPSNKKQKWHLIQNGNSERIRQIAWVEIDQDQYIYLLEMEINSSESGRSTQLIIGKNFEYMPESDFKIFLRMTAVKNRWPKYNHSWNTPAAKNAAHSFFDQYQTSGLSHPKSVSQEERLDKTNVNDWASHIETKILQRLG